MSLDQPPPHQPTTLPTDLPSPGSAVAPHEHERSTLLRVPRGRPTPLLQIRRWLRILGPGLVTGAADDDPSGIGTYSQAGAAYGTGQLWLALYMLPLLIAVQEMCARIGLVTGKGIAAVVRQHYSRRVLFVAVGLVLVANTLNVGADLGAMAATVQLLVPGAPFLFLIVVVAGGILALEVFVPYQRYAVVLKVLALSLFAYVATGLIVGPRGIDLLRATVVPNIEFTPAFLALVVGVLGTTISPYLFFWQASEEVEEVKVHHREPRGTDWVRQRQALLGRLRALRIDTVLGMLLSEVATWFIIFTTGSVLHTHGVTTITTADQAAAALEPLVHTFPYAGTLAKAIFAVGILGVGLLGIPVLAGSAAYAVAEAFHWKEGLAQTLRQAPGFYAVIGVATLVGLTLNLLRINPILALVYSAIINGVVAVPLLVLILLIANNRAIMQRYTNGRLANAVGILTVLGMGAAAIAAVLLFLKG
jgi:NRAMP (natural resistance-associated macrophage protein)-like metal ion transporter